MEKRKDQQDPEAAKPSKSLSATAFRADLSKVLDRVRYFGESYTVELHGEPVANVTPVDGQAK